jgi:hypothetical protein
VKRDQPLHGLSGRVGAVLRDLPEFVQSLKTQPWPSDGCWHTSRQLLSVHKLDARFVSFRKHRYAHRLYGLKLGFKPPKSIIGDLCAALAPVIFLIMLMGELY